MKRRYFINGWQESREYFLQMLGSFTYEEYDTLIRGGEVYRDRDVFYIENVNGL